MKDALDKIFGEKHSKKKKEKIFERFFRMKRVKGKNLEEVVETQHPNLCSDLITVKNWANHKTSFWIKIKWSDRVVVLDSGIIESLAKELKKLKKPYAQSQDNVKAIK